MIEDINLELLFNLGMPANATRVLVKVPGIHCGPRFTDYSVEILGTKIDPIDFDSNDAVGGIAQYSTTDGIDAYMRVWLRRVRWRHTNATIEEIWKPESGWLTMICGIEDTPHSTRIKEVQKLAEGLWLAVEAAKQLPEIGRGPEFTLEQFRQLAIQAAHKLGKQGKSITKGSLARELQISRGTVYNYLNNDKGLWDLLENENLKIRSSSIAKED